MQELITFLSKIMLNIKDICISRFFLLPLRAFTYPSMDTIRILCSLNRTFRKLIDFINYRNLDGRIRFGRKIDIGVKYKNLLKNRAKIKLNYQNERNL